MNQLANFCKSLKKDFTPKINDSTKPVRCWSEKDIFNRRIVDAFVIILRTRGCSWALQSGCSMCGYFNDSMWDKVSENDLLDQFETTLKYYSGEKFVKIFTSGSFLDDSEVSPKVREKILSRLVETADKISFESRPEYITDEKLSVIQEKFGTKTVEVGVGLESGNDFVREHAINKGFSFQDYYDSVKTLKKYNVSLKTYVLVKPLFLTENESIHDSISTIKKIDLYTDTISLNPTNVQRNTVVDFLWKRNQYRPAWLWSIIEILKQSRKVTKAHIKCDIAGGGSIRGAHNCKLCDHMVLDAIADFSLSQDTKLFDELDCECKDTWLDQLDFEHISFGSVIDFSRGFV
jgi:radical SAM enzyme (TIGR01210 family)